MVVDERQISRLRYLPGKFLRRANGDNKWHPPMWKGMIQDKNSKEVECVVLTQDWVTKNIPEAFQQLLMNLRDEENKGYVLIPEGRNKQHHEEVVTFLSNAPQTKFWNKTKSLVKRRCVMDSVASGLEYLGHKRLAYFCSSNVDDVDKEMNGMEFFERVIVEKSEEKERKLFQIVRLN